MSKRNVVIGVAALLAALSSLEAGAATSAVRTRDNVVLVTLDTTRADRLGCYGYRAGDTPVLDALAAHGVRFEEALTSVPMTLPAHATILTGLEPPEHGIRVNGKQTLSTGVATLAEELAARGYQTGAFLAAFVLNRKFGLDRGFGTYDDDLAGAPKQEVPERLSMYRPGNLVTDAALGWLDRVVGTAEGGGTPARPFFCWLHLYDTHYPYAVHTELAQARFAGTATYDAELAFMDGQVGRIVAFLKEHNLIDSTLVVVVGDHGEGLGEHGEVEHGYLLNVEALHVPLIISLPGRVREGGRVPGLVSLVDIVPTIHDLLGMPPPTAGHGRSLAPALEGQVLPPVPSYAETDLPYTSFGWSPLRSLTTSEWKYVRTTRPELYDRQADPGELHNLADARPDQLAVMESQLSAAERQMVGRSAPTVALAPGERARLQALGYLADGPLTITADAPSGLKDIKDMLPVKHLESRLARGLATGTLGKNEALDLARELVARSPESPGFERSLGIALAGVGQLDEAIARLNEALRLRPDFPEAHGSLGDVLVRKGMLDDGMAHYATAVRLDPGFAPAQVGLGNLLAARGQRKAALRAYAVAIRVAPDYAEAHNNMGNVFAQLGQMKPAIEHYRAALRAKPDFPLAHYNLGRLLARLGRREEASMELKEALRLQPGFVQARDALTDILGDQSTTSK
jgi:arylsulfatase A-like enzyme/Flp pilus assembly protein TadD